ncbi:MAG: pitrilysin family protein [Elusimicrobiota bacterium]|nr:insulinase family protein [Endomicrobiia bacterium]MDW8055546.1 pitrilysin family protein [Elusimicrobiota bacterium]
MNTQLIGKVRKDILDNGVIFIHNYNTEQPIVSVVIFIKMGAVYEPLHLTGISELVQATITKGTKNRTAKQIVEEIESLGGEISADSDTDYSTLSISVGSIHYEKAIEILHDVFTNPIFPEEEVEKEKMNIIAGIIARKDRIFNVAIDELLLNIYGKQHPYGRPPERIIRTIRKIKRENLLSWWEKFYGIDNNLRNIVIVVSGDVDFLYAKEIIMKYFSSIRRTQLPFIQDYKLRLKRKYVSRKVHFKQAYLMYGFLAPAVGITDIREFLSLKLLNLYLGGGMSGKLFEILREQYSLCYETNSFYPTRILDSHFVFYLGLDHTRVELAKNKIEEIIYLLKDGKIFDEKDLEETKRKFSGRYLLDHQTNARQAWYLGFWEIVGLGYEYDAKYIEDIKTVTLDDIHNTVNKIFSKEKAVVVELIPKKK